MEMEAPFDGLLVLFSTYSKQTEMVFGRDIPSCSPREVLIQYLRCALIEILRQALSKTELTAIAFLSGWKTYLLGIVT